MKYHSLLLGHGCVQENWLCCCQCQDHVKDLKGCTQQQAWVQLPLRWRIEMDFGYESRLQNWREGTYRQRLELSLDRLQCKCPELATKEAFIMPTFWKGLPHEGPAYSGLLSP